MNTLFVAMQDPASRRWAPVGRLTRDKGQYRFVYTRGCRTMPDFAAFGRLTDLNAEYVSEELFPLFSNRVLAKARPEYPRYRDWLGLAPGDDDALDELGRTGGIRATDRLEVIPCPEPTEDGRYEIRFFTRGLRHLQPESRAGVEGLSAGERLFLMRDDQNERDPLALLMRTGDPIRLAGYVPRYYTDDVRRLEGMVGPQALEVYVEAVNRDAPLGYRLRCRLTAPWPEGFAACGAPEFRPLTERAN
jgi:hypothetical protein